MSCRLWNTKLPNTFSLSYFSLQYVDWIKQHNFFRCLLIILYLLFIIFVHSLLSPNRHCWVIKEIFFPSILLFILYLDKLCNMLEQAPPNIVLLCKGSLCCIRTDIEKHFYEIWACFLCCFIIYTYICEYMRKYLI